MEFKRILISVNFTLPVFGPLEDRKQRKNGPGSAKEKEEEEEVEELADRPN